MGLRRFLITAYLSYSEALSHSSDITTNITELDTICTYYLGTEASLGYQHHSGFVSEQNISPFSLCLAFSSALEDSISCVNQ